MMCILGKGSCVISTALLQAAAVDHSRDLQLDLRTMIPADCAKGYEVVKKSVLVVVDALKIV